MESKSPVLRFWQKAWWSKLILVGLGFFIWPFVVGGGISYLLANKIKSPLLKWLLIFPIIGSSIFFGTAWVAAFILPSQPKKEVAVITSPTPSTQVISPLPFPTQVPTVIPTVEAISPIPTEKPTPTFTPTPTSAPTPSPIPTSIPTQAKQVSASVFKKFFVDHFDYQQFTKAFGTSDKWEFWESFNPDDDHLILGVTGDDLKSGILKASPNEISSIQIVSFFQMGYPPLVSSGWVENAVSDLKLGDTRQTIIDNVSAKITLTYANIWIVSFIEE